MGSIIIFYPLSLSVDGNNITLTGLKALDMGKKPPVLSQFLI